MNLKLRWQNKAFWVSVIALIGLIVQFICKNYGLAFDVTGLNEILTAVLTCAVALGLVMDPTTPGAGDSSVTMAKMRIEETAKDVLENKEDK